MRGLTLSVVFIALLALGCTGLRPSQRDDIPRWEAETARLGHPEVKYVKYLNPGAATGLGFLPGGGFYVSPGLGVSSLIWPLSIMWVPGTARAKAERYNYMEFRARVFAVRQAAERNVSAPPRNQEALSQLRRLEKLWNAGRLSEPEYLEQRDKLERLLEGEDSNQPVR